MKEGPSDKESHSSSPLYPFPFSQVFEPLSLFGPFPSQSLLSPPYSDSRKKMDLERKIDSTIEALTMLYIQCTLAERLIPESSIPLHYYFRAPFSDFVYFPACAEKWATLKDLSYITMVTVSLPAIEKRGGKKLHLGFFLFPPFLPKTLSFFFWEYPARRVLLPHRPKYSRADCKCIIQPSSFSPPLSSSLISGAQKREGGGERETLLRKKSPFSSSTESWLTPSLSSPLSHLSIPHAHKKEREVAAMQPRGGGFPPNPLQRYSACELSQGRGVSKARVSGLGWGNELLLAVAAYV